MSKIRVLPVLLPLLLVAACNTPPDMTGDGSGDMNSNGSMDGDGDGGDMSSNGGDMSSNGGGNLPALRINAAAPDAVHDRLFLSGEFGDAQGTVRCGSDTLNVVSWGPANPKPQSIECDLPRTSFGNVQVESGNSVSNVVQLTRWDLHMVSRSIVRQGGTQGQINVDITVDFIIRACLNDLLTHGPGGFSVLSGVSRDSTANVHAFGMINVMPPPPTHSFESFTGLDIPGQDFLVVYPGDVYDADAEKFLITGATCYAMRQDAGGGGGLKLLYTLSGIYNLRQQLDMDVFNSEQRVGFATNTYFDTSQPILFHFGGSGFDIQPGMATAFNAPDSMLEWSGAAAQSPPED